jgi:hypothetical protein
MKREGEHHRGGVVQGLRRAMVRNQLLPPKRGDAREDIQGGAEGGVVV